ncbi:MAG: asparagine synthase (glutamine-hydrolyzing) [Bdellovibrionota bacterium]
MCGIVGAIQPHGESLEPRIGAMNDAIRYRGPDSSGIWTDPACGVGFGHLRLAIVDLSPEGHQPMVSAGGRYVITFNGEVYNHAALSAELGTLGHTFRGHSDTEVMLAAFEEWGVEASLKRFIGMFVFALWDRTERRLFLARDRLGIKPLFYCWSKGTFLFGSELKALRAHPEFVGEIDRDALAEFLRFGYVPGPRSIYRSVFKLTPGCMLTLAADDLRSMPQGFQAEGMLPFPSQWLRPFWSLREVGIKGQQKLFQGSDDEAIDRLEKLLKDSIGLRMVADVPLGAFLSGGIDSTTVVALMQAQHSQPVRTFSIGFNEPGFNEAEHAKAVAAHLGTDHTELYVGNDELLSVVPTLADMYDEPFGDSSQIPTFLVSQLARKHVTVALSGDGGDEIFCGYNRYVFPTRFWSYLKFLPHYARARVAAMLAAIPEAAWSKILRPFESRFDKPGERIQKVCKLLCAEGMDDLYLRLLAQWMTPTDLVVGSSGDINPFVGKPCFESVEPFEQRAMLLDQELYLPDDNLQKVDRASMRVALEVRVPLLDHRVVELSARLPIKFKYRDGKTKWLLRQVLYRHVPRALVERPKMGFSVPIGTWLRGPLRDWACDLLRPETLRRDGFVRPEPVGNLLSEHLSGAQNRQHQLWNILMFQAWLKSTQ